MRTRSTSRIPISNPWDLYNVSTEDMQYVVLGPACTPAAIESTYILAVEEFMMFLPAYKENLSLDSTYLTQNRQHFRCLALKEFLRLHKGRSQLFRFYDYLLNLSNREWTALFISTVDLDYAKALTNEVNAIIEKAPRISEETIVYRSVFVYRPQDVRHYKEIGREHAISTTLKADTAAYMVEGLLPVYQIILQPGDRALYVGPFSAYPHQFEMLISPYDEHVFKRYLPQDFALIEDLFDYNEYSATYMDCAGVLNSGMMVETEEVEGNIQRAQALGYMPSPYID